MDLLLDHVERRAIVALLHDLTDLVERKPQPLEVHDQPHALELADLVVAIACPLVDLRGNQQP